MNTQELRNQAEYYKILYHSGGCSRELANEMIQPYLNFVNSKAKELSKKYHQKYKKIEFSYYIR